MSKKNKIKVEKKKSDKREASAKNASKQTLKTESRENGNAPKAEGMKNWKENVLPDKFVRCYKDKNYTLERKQNGWSVNGRKAVALRDAMNAILKEGGITGGRTCDNFFRTIKPIQ